MRLVLSLLLLTTSTVARAGERVALVIANSRYVNVSRLPNPSADGALVAASLRKAGFRSVQVVQDADKMSLEAALQRFGTAADGADVAMIYYAGHGMEVAGRNYLIPVSARLLRDRDADVEAVSLDTVLSMVEGAKLRVIVLDACRVNPFAISMASSGTGRGVGRGLARIEPVQDTLVVYAAKAGALAADGDGANSPFASALAHRMIEPGVEISLTFRRVRDDVLKATGRQQEPFTYGSLSGTEFYFVPSFPGRPVAGQILQGPSASVVSSLKESSKPSAQGLALWGLNTHDLSTMPELQVLTKAHFAERRDEILTAAKTDESAQLLVGFAMDTGIGLEQDEVAAGKVFKHLARGGSLRAMVDLGSAYEHGNGGISQDYKQAMEWYQSAANGGNVLAIFNVGSMYERGLGTPKDYMQAIHWYSRAAALGSGSAMFNIGTLYETGKGVSQDYNQAMQWYRRAANVGDTDAEYNIAVLYEYGEGVPKDVDQAVRWYRRAAALGDEDAKNALSRLGR